MLYLQETTKWSDNTPNHIYITTEDRCSLIGFIPLGKTKEVRFDAPMRFSTKGREFKMIKRVPDIGAKSKSWTVRGSKGDSYIVTESDGKLICTCPGFQFRGRCRHIEECK